MTSRIQAQRNRVRRIPAEPFIDAHGADQVRAVSLATHNRADEPYFDLPKGQILAKRDDENLHHPCAADEAGSDVSSGTTIEVDDPFQFFVGDYVDCGDDGTWREITEVDHDNDQITIGSAVSLTEGDALVVDPSRSFDEADSDATDSTTLTVSDASRFAVGDMVTIGTANTVEVTAVDEGTNELTLDATRSWSAGDLVVSNPDGQYKVAVETIHFYSKNGAFHAQNVLCGTRQHGEAREPVLTGLIPDARTALEPMITFNESTRI